MAAQRANWIALKVALTVAFVALGIIYVARRKEEFMALDWPSATAVLAVAVAYAVNVGLVSVYNVITARRLGTHLAAGESFMLSAVAAAGNFLLPVKAGAGIRAAYMKRVHGFPVSFFTSSSVIYTIVSIIVVSLLAIALLFAVYLQQGYFRLDLSILFPVIMVVSVAGLATLGLNVPRADANDGTWSGSFRSSLHAITSQKRLLGASFLIVVAIFLVAAIVWTVALTDYAPGITVAEAFLLAASQIVSGFVSLTPGAAGFQEIAGLYVGRSFAATTTEIFAVLLWVRLVRVVTAVVIAIPAAWVLNDRLRARADDTRGIRTDG